ncbi:hypothetical protein [Pararhizobium sp. O133]|uniref:hypothetical protein n=1 Tax=Pararhizobium sp. O133 TaxID=3449278 RepID=UPI003F683BA7
MSLKHVLSAVVALAVSFPAFAADDWTGYVNPRFGFNAAVPPGFALARESDNGEGATFRSDDGRSELLLFGTTIVDGDFSDEVRQRIVWNRNEDWNITYDKVTKGWASYSGAKDSDILYVRGVLLCDGSAAYFHLRYPQDALKHFNPLIGRMVKTLRPAGGCEQSPKAAPGAAQN